MKYIRRTSKDITDNFVGELLFDRGIIKNDPVFLENFTHPRKETNELEPSLLDNMEEGYQLLMKHLKNHSKIYLPVDSDCDGFTSASLFYNYLNDHFSDYEPNITYHIPDGKEHGLDSLLDWFPEDGTNSLIVVPDAGSNDINEHHALRARGYEILVLDHHLVSEVTDSAIIINNQSSERYENKDLSGIGVVYKFFEYLEEKEGLPPYSQDYLDIVALGLIGDMMVMTSLENRFILTYGLTHIKNKFFRTLLEKQDFSLKGERTQIGIAFYIVPLINSMIRLGTQQDKEKLFLAFTHPELVYPSTKRGHKEGDTETICEQMARICTNTKNRQNKERDKALELLDIQIIENCLNDNKIIVLNADELDIPKTLTGLCAMGVVSKYKKPVIIGRIDSEGYLKGSMRAPSNSPIQNFKEFLLDSNLMDFVEGHAMAAGASLKNSNVDKLVEYANNKLKDIDFNEGFWEVDFIVNGNCSYLEELIQQLAEGKEFWGQGCPEAMIAIENITINTKDFSYKGPERNTVAFNFNGIEYIKFKDDDLVDLISQYNGKINVTIVGIPQINEWGGRTTKQIQIKGIEIKEIDALDF